MFSLLLHSIIIILKETIFKNVITRNVFIAERMVHLLKAAKWNMAYLGTSENGELEEIFLKIQQYFF